ncbi:NAD-dependent epimerase/dehydratase family protein [Micromonospora harpali]|jgi:dTDP-glucose 4,6-dehydratase|uniref:dTDP-glucose 4,6-dehydratase n=3 Tax=Micromonospora TaxID=1873 RepID=A0A1C4UDW0_9ACTN|nr:MULTISPECIES: NAD-dependent epimerase/dehydratase family protein [Micromonospora]MBB5829911.1 dTDP-glucose 4,6-dehydratase [Micromonospora carbonacea]MDG4816180.1 GDP-mannose 4,6-dehydratase [Micromonospora sp. WMMD956]OON33301.1 epimerase [Micromonospora sp. Rc5]QLD28132.1 GDP-mannose 4,6-dehydratase [Micromonospora carbonacea]WFE58714.1 GDP-mannose 4,6-dehydratase [Micromonospora sp. WMMD712]
MKVAPRFGPGHRVLVTGGAGFVPSHLVDTLVARGCTVVALDNFVTGSKDNVAHLHDKPNFTLVEADISDGLPTHHPALAERFDAIMHMASPASPTDFATLPVEILRVGSVATLHLLDRAVADGARFLMASTSEAYGDPKEHPQRETYWGNVNPIGVRSVYDEAKRFSEAATMAYHRYRGLDAAIVRIFNTYGPRMRPDDGRAIPTFISQALRGEPITVHGTGNQTRSICYVEDLVRGILLLLDSTETGPVNCGTEHELTMRQLAELIVSLSGSTSEVTYVTRAADDPEMRRPDLTLARELLGYEPAVAPEDGLRRTIEHFRERLG